MVEWYYGRDGRNTGPVTMNELRELAGSGELLPADLVWNESFDDWREASTIGELFPRQDETSPTEEAEASVESSSQSADQSGPPPLTAVDELDESIASQELDDDLNAAEQSERSQEAESARSAIEHGEIEFESTESTASETGDSTTAVPPPFPDAVPSKPAKWMAAISDCYSDTVRHAKHLAGASAAKWRERSLRRSLMDARVALSDWICAHETGDESLRRQIAEMDDRIKSVKAADGSNRSLDVEMRGLKVRLASNYVENRPNDDSADPQALARVHEAAQSLVDNAEELAELHTQILPRDRQRLVRVGVGYGACLLLLMAVVFWPRSSRQVVAAASDEQRISQALGLVVAGADVTAPDGTKAERQLGTGTCFAVTANGYLVTNKHVVEPMTKLKSNRLLLDRFEKQGFEVRPRLWVFFGKDAKYRADVEYVSDDHDLAILKIDAENLPVFQLSGRDEIPRASKVYGCGFPGAAEAPLSDEELAWTKAVQQTASAGKLERQFKPRDFEFVLTGGQVSRMSVEKEGRAWVQHDAEISPGNSGGPLILENGVVVGINTLTHTKEAGVSWALGIAQLKKELDKNVEGTLLWNVK
ncbi:MAG: trypsin-like peptidase domain-containing protein [Planctomycetota bacterium]|nr:trypsin-like peptidase domain-containing protein [Planctomycetota bacterium]